MSGVDNNAMAVVATRPCRSWRLDGEEGEGEGEDEDEDEGGGVV